MTETPKSGVIGVRCILGNVSMEDHLECQRSQQGPPCGIAPTILAGMLRPKADREGVVFSPSSIQDCQRRHALQTDHTWYLDVDKAYQLYRGDLFHAGLKEEPAPPGVMGVVRELRLHSPIDTNRGVQTFSGQVDEITLILAQDGVLHVRVVDWKSKNEIPHTMLEADRDHVFQINEYRLLVERELLRYLQGWSDNKPDHLDARLYMNGPVDIETWLLLHGVFEIVVDEMAIVYLDSRRTRTFHSETFLWTKGKMLGESTMGSDGRMHFHAFRPKRYEDVELAPLEKWQLEYTEQVIREGIERQMDSEETLAPPLEGDDALRKCESCSVRQACYDIGIAQQYDMKWQRPYVDHA